MWIFMTSVYLHERSIWFVDAAEEYTFVCCQNNLTITFGYVEICNKTNKRNHLISQLKWMFQIKRFKGEWWNQGKLFWTIINDWQKHASLEWLCLASLGWFEIKNCMLLEEIKLHTTTNNRTQIHNTDPI